MVIFPLATDRYIAQMWSNGDAKRLLVRSAKNQKKSTMHIVRLNADGDVKLTDLSHAHTTGTSTLE